MGGHTPTQKDLRPMWVLVSLSAALKADLTTLASVERMGMDEYCAHALNIHVNGRRGVLALATTTQKEQADERPDPLGR